MNIILVLIPLSIVLVVLAVAAFFWAVNNEQFDDMDAAALDILSDDPEPLPAEDQNSEPNADDSAELENDADRDPERHDD